MKIVPWNKYETVLLIEAYINVSSGKEKRKDAVRRLSMDFRNLAISNGQTIDNIYRNENGIDMQMATIEYLFTNRERSYKEIEIHLNEIADRKRAIMQGVHALMLDGKEI